MTPFDISFYLVVVVMSWGSIMNWGGIMYWGNNFGNWCNNFVSEWCTVYDCVESVVVISGVFDCTLETIGIDKAVEIFRL